MRSLNLTHALLLVGLLLLALLAYAFGVPAVLQGAIWVACGALFGWLGSLVFRTRRQQGILLDILSGAVGALAGLLLLGAPISGGGPLEQFLAAVVGAVLAIAISVLARGWRPGRRRKAEG